MPSGLVNSIYYVCIEVLYLIDLLSVLVVK